jgi:hypothetical protein
MPRRNSWNLLIDEVSGLGRRRDPASGRSELLAVGDRGSIVATITADGSGHLPVDGDHRHVAVRHSVRGIPGDLTGARQSDWEGVAGDAAGRVFILRESDSRVLIVSPTFEFEGSVSLDWDPRDGTSLESLLLLANGHFLSATQETPLRILEFAAPGAGPADIGRWTALPADRPMPLPREREVHCAAVWSVSTDRVKSANDLALFGQHLFAISSRSRSIARFRLPPQGVHALELDAEWPLPDHIADGRDDKAEGLLVDAGFGVLVGVDRRPGAPGPNLHELDRNAVETEP